MIDAYQIVLNEVNMDKFGNILLGNTAKPDIKQETIRSQTIIQPETDNRSTTQSKNENDDE